VKNEESTNDSLSLVQLTLDDTCRNSSLTDDPLINSQDFAANSSPAVLPEGSVEYHGNRSLFEAVKNNDYAAAANFLRNGTNVNEHGPNGLFPIHIACKNGNLEMVKLLVDVGGADVNECAITEYAKKSTMQLATETDNLSLVKYLFEKGVDVVGEKGKGCNPLSNACSNGNLDMARFLVDSKAPIDGTGRIDIPLRWAAIENYLDVVVFLVENGANINQPDSVGVTPFGHACVNNNTEIARYLFEHGDRLLQTESSRAQFSMMNDIVKLNEPEIILFLQQNGFEDEGDLEKALVAQKQREKSSNTP